MTRNKQKAREARLRWYYKNRETELINQKIRTKNTRERLRKWFKEYKENLSCTICNMSFKGRTECCDFHHVNPLEKDFLINRALTHGLKTVKKEISKCIPLCANCHRTKHAQEKISAHVP
jgi:hypothetical protein